MQETYISEIVPHRSYSIKIYTNTVYDVRVLMFNTLHMYAESIR